jgi:hypothetical protein
VSVTGTASSISFNGNDVADEFALPFRVLEDDDLLVRTTDDHGETYTTLVLDTDYELAGVGPDDGTGTAEAVTLTLLAGPLPTDTQLVIERNTDPDQETTFQPQGTFSPILHSRMADKLTLLVQELLRRVAVLEALADLVNVTELATAAVFTEDVAGSVDDIENAFPFEVAVAGGQNARFAVFRVFTDDDSVLDVGPNVQWRPGPADKITILKIDGLAATGGGGPFHINGMVFF